MIHKKSRDEIKRIRHAGHIVALVHKKMREVLNLELVQKNWIALHTILSEKNVLFLHF